MPPTLGVAAETDVAQPIAAARRVFIGKAIEEGEVFEVLPSSPTAIPVGLVVDYNKARGILARREIGPVPVGRAVEVSAAHPVRHDGRVVILSRALERSVVRRIARGATTITSAVGETQTAVWTFPTGAAGLKAALLLDILEPMLEGAPTAAMINVTGAIPNRSVEIFIDGVHVQTVPVASDDQTGLASISIDEQFGRVGEHVMRVEQVGALPDEAIFTLLNPVEPIPSNPGTDAPPVLVPGSLHPSGVRRWVLQDMMPGGAGSFVFPHNPEEMDPLGFERALSGQHTTAVNTGRWHVSEAPAMPKDWSFKGYCPNLEMAERLRTFGDLKRRFYLHDHRGRAWVVAAQTVDLVPRLHQSDIYGKPSNEIFDYTFTCVLYDQEPVQL